jgi:hypothetical protein
MLKGMASGTRHSIYEMLVAVLDVAWVRAT